MASEDDSGRSTENDHTTIGSTDNDDATQSRLTRTANWVSDTIRGVAGPTDDVSTVSDDDLPRSPYVRRYLGLDSPDSVDDDTPPEWFADRLETGTNPEECYGWFDGQPMEPSRSDERRVSVNQTGMPADSLSEPDQVQSASDYIIESAAKLTDSTGDQLVGVASSADDSISDGRLESRIQHYSPLVPLETLDSRTRRLREMKLIPDDEQILCEAEGLETRDLEVTLPDGTSVPLCHVVSDPGAYSRSSIPGIENRLALEAEIKKVSESINGPGYTTGAAAVIDRHMDSLAAFRMAHEASLPERREAKLEETKQKTIQRVRDRAEPLRTLHEWFPDKVDPVCKLARRILSDEFPHAHEINKSRVTIAAQLAECVLDGQSLDSALFTVADQEKHDPTNVLKIGNITYTNTETTNGYVTTQGRVKRVYYPDNPKIKFGFILEDDSGWAYVAIWNPSEREITRSTSDPNDVDGEVVVSRKCFMEPKEGDLVRLTDFRKTAFQDRPSLNSRWESEIHILESAESSMETNPRPATPQRVGRSSSATKDGTSIPRSPAANYSGEISTRWPAPSQMEQIIATELSDVADQNEIREATESSHQNQARDSEPLEMIRT
ncbi:nucleic acid binding OB-fold tRNA/helicase-type [Halosimplex carlsbadense 2-9-1]|uniref:Nucleic acid binding OB-fold tRNA/helicase-type n=1 Tax=Halosimplex carlsbadense 2-9-1 TaxID=797114 RepID=M0C8Y7_9EURY|nr:nucleic acid binding OB-fold tRNA/helicase-type [Halosimplex carlsbadense 2-9-1]